MCVCKTKCQWDSQPTELITRKSSISSQNQSTLIQSEWGYSDMDDFGKSLCGWSWEENKLFELALAMVDEQHPERWEVVAAMVGGEKSAGEVQEHYMILLEDLHVIESGKLDHKLGEIQLGVLVECKESLCLSHNDDTWYKQVITSPFYLVEENMFRMVVITNKSHGEARKIYYELNLLGITFLLIKLFVVTCWFQLVHSIGNHVMYGNKRHLGIAVWLKV